MAGITNINEEGQRIRVKRIHQHPGFSFFDLQHDISTLYLDESLTLSSSVALVALPYQDAGATPGKEVTVTGWGATSEGGWGSDILQSVNVEIISNENCNDSYGSGSITDGMLCAGVPQGNL